MAIFKGAAVAIVTPMHEDGKVNYEKLEELLEYQIANSTDAIVICGTTGESSTLTHGEHLQTIKFAIDKVAGRVPVIAGTGSNCSQIAKMMSMADGALELYSGNDDQVLPILSLGGLGVISVLSNVAPKNTHDMVMKFMEGDLAGAARLQLEAVPLINALFCEVNPIPVKTALNLMGWKVGPTRMPLCEMEPENEERLKKALADYGIKLA